MEIHSVFDAASKYHVGFEFERKIKKLSGDDLPDFQAKLPNFTKKQISRERKKISKKSERRFEEEPPVNVTMCQLGG